VRVTVSLKVPISCAISSCVREIFRGIEPSVTRPSHLAPDRRCSSKTDDQLNGKNCLIPLPSIKRKSRGGNAGPSRVKSPLPSPVIFSGGGQSVLETLGFEGEYD
jgi:hypothetical protein